MERVQTRRSNKKPVSHATCMQTGTKNIMQGGTPRGKNRNRNFASLHPDRQNPSFEILMQFLQYRISHRDLLAAKNILNLCNTGSYWLLKQVKNFPSP